MSNLTPHFLDYTSYNVLKENATLTKTLVSTYQEIFNDAKVWGEHYTDNEVLANLREELSGNAGIRLCIDSNNHRELLGFFWAQCLAYDEIVSSIQTVQYYQSLGRPPIDQMLQRIIGHQTVIYLHDLGISNQHRGQVPLHQLICPVLETLAERTHIRRIFFWSIADTRVYRLAQRAGYQLVGNIDRMQFFMGSI